MKNKKLFAILTLVCFMMTLMPVAAFAAPNEGVNYQNCIVYTDDENASANVSTSESKDNVTVKFDFDGQTVTTNLYVWFVKEGTSAPALGVTKGADKGTDGIFTIASPSETADYDFQFENTGKYTVYAAFNNPADLKIGSNKTWAEAMNDVEYKLGALSNHKVIEITSSSNSSKYAANVAGLTGKGDKVTFNSTDYYKDGAEFGSVNVQANNVAEKELTVKIVDNAGKAVKGETVTFETNSANIELNKEKATTDQLGQVKFKIAGVRDGDYKVYVKCGSYEATILVQVGATGAQDIKVVKSPSAPIDVTSDLGKKIQFTFTDANGNAVETTIAKENGAWAAFNSNTNGTKGNITNPKPYVAIVSQPSASKAENKDFYLVVDKDNDYKASLAYCGSKDLAEGTYEIKVVLDNGKYVTVKFEVKEFATPVALNLKYEADAVELDSTVEIDTLEWVDANGVTKDCTGKVDLAATGYAVANFDTEKGSITVKNDDKYVGSKITVVAVDDRYNLTAKAELVVCDEASALAFDTKTLAIDTNNKVGVAVVDSEGNKVALNRTGATATISYVVLDKPEGAKVSVTTDGADNNILTEGTFKMNVTANKVGNVTIQAVAKVTYQDDKSQKTVVKYYTGTQIFAVGKTSVGDVVVMSVGSNEIVINDAKATIDAAPIVKNDRTFVPFRALAEAFGAEVAYDEATQAVTAELNGVKVVMTIGSATYTVNGAEKTMDVAPFINGSRTMVPVRFVAESFGIKVIPTYDENGATADILFNL